MEHDEEASPIASDECNRKQKPSGDVSDYTVIALQGGHKGMCCAEYFLKHNLVHLTLPRLFT